MVYACVVTGCSRKAQKHVRTLHEFPTPGKDSAATVNAWKQFVRRTRADWKGVTKCSRICSDHFEERCYVNWTAWRMKVADKLQLKMDQVPTKYPEASPAAPRNEDINVARGRPSNVTSVELAAGRPPSQTCGSPSLDDGGDSAMAGAGKVVTGPPASLLDFVTSDGPSRSSEKMPRKHRRAPRVPKSKADAFSHQLVELAEGTTYKSGDSARKPGCRPKSRGGAMSASWRDDDEEFKVGGARGVLRSKPRFSFNEIKLLLEAVKRNRNILLKKFNHGVSSEVKKQKWAEITDQVNALGENHREMRQIMKKWADLKCDGKRRIVALRGPNGTTIRKKTLGPVEKMVQDILMMSPSGDGESDLDFPPDQRLSKLHSRSSPSYLNLTDNAYSLGGALDMSPLSSPDKDGEPFQSSSEFDQDVAEEDQTVDLKDKEDSMFSCPDPLPPSAFTEPLSDDALLSVKPFHTYSRPPAGPSTSSTVPDGEPSSSATASESTSRPSSSAPPPAAAAAAPSSASKPQRSSSDPLPAGGATRGEHLFQVASQSLQQQQASRLLLTSVSQSLEALAQSVQLLVETQQEFVQESLMLQRETVDILRDFSNTALAMLRDKNSTGQTRF